MGRLHHLPLLLVAGLALAACSKKKETPPTNADSSAAETPKTASSSEEPTVRFRVPGEAATTPAPTTSTPAPLPTAETPATASGAGKDALQLPAVSVLYPPFYPLSWRMEGVEGKVVLEFAIDDVGNVTDVTVAAASAPQFRDYTLEAARLWRFVPAQLNGKAISYRVQIPWQYVSEFGSGQLLSASPLAQFTYLDGLYYTAGKDGHRVPATISDPIPLLRVQPAFDPQKAGGKELRVTITFGVTEEGRVIAPKIVDSSQTEFDQAALAAVSFWQFVPRMREGKPVQSSVKLPIVYNPTETSAPAPK